MDAAEFQKLVLERFGALAELEKHLLRVERAFRREMHHPQRIREYDEDDELDEALSLYDDDEEED